MTQDCQCNVVVRLSELSLLLVGNPGASDVWFSLGGTTYQNNSCVALEEIGEENDTALLCMTNQTACCGRSYTENQSGIGTWYFPNGTRVPFANQHWGFYGKRGQSVIGMYRRRGGEEGIYHCEIPDSMNVLQILYIGVYTTNTRE